jgi:hypothetical protein
MKTIHWLGLGVALLAAAGIAVVTQDASAQVVRLFPGNARLLSVPEATRLQQAVATCWPHPPTTLRGVRLYRGDGEDAGRVFADISGEGKMTREEARAAFRAGERVPRGLAKAVDPVVRCELSQAPRLAAARDLVAVLWPYAFDTWRWSAFEIDPAGRAVRCTGTRGAVGLSEDQMLDLIESGEEVEIVGLIQ